MANRADPAWEKFFQYFEKYDGTPAEIAARFNEGEAAPVVTAAEVRNWRRKHSRPPLGTLTELGYYWAGDPFYFARLLGAVPTEGLGAELYAQKRIIELRHEVHALEAQVRAADTTAATGRIVAAATASGRWAVAAHPAIEGPTGVPIHVADRLEFRYVGTRLKSGETLHETLEEDLAEAFRQNHVVPAPNSQTVWRDDRATDSLSYSVAHTLSPFGPSRMWNHVGVESIAVISTTLGTWVFDVAAVVARMIGYGFINTRGLSQGRRPLPQPTTPADLASYRTEAHQELLSSPWPRYVWGHVGEWDLPAASQLLAPNGVAPQVKIVWLRESDSLIDGLASGAEHTGLTTADEYRATLLARHREILEAMTDGPPVHIVDCESAPAGADGRRTLRWERSFTLAARIVTHLVDTNDILMPALTRSLQKLSDPLHADPINAAVLEWLQTTEWLTTWGVDPLYMRG
ncbi:hypothetical protein ACFQNE_03270 [Gordonia phosphorivorans]|uniref:Uncharacterized protein n=1 Tax=Gordonia phosphorivorans TaxID=1056982 RepID=A0ABV6H3T6_9ACTN